MQPLRDKLSNPAYFGPSGSYSTSPFVFVDIGTPTTASLTANGCNIWLSGYDNVAPYSDLLTFANNGGFVIGGCDDSGFSAVCQGMGFPVTNYSNVGGAYTVATPINPLTCDAGVPNASLSLTTSGGFSGYFTSGSVYARYSDASAFPLVVTNNTTSPYMVLTGDIDMFTSVNPNITLGPTITTDQDQFIANVFKLAADRVTGALAANGQPACGNISLPPPPQIRIQKTTTGAAGGAFSFSATNLVSSPSNITTSATDSPTPSAPAGIEIATLGTAVTITETPVSGFTLVSASCVDANSATTGNTGLIGTLSGNTLTIPAANVTAGVDYTCTFTNAAPGPSGDYGDAPASYGNPYTNQRGFFRLGPTVNLETSNPYDNSATDDDGVVIPTLTQGATATIPVNYIKSGSFGCFINGWIDWNGDGDFSDIGEQVATNLACAGTAGTTNISVTVPTNATTNETYARFKINFNSGATATSSDGFGEIEDYPLTIIGRPTVRLTKISEGDVGSFTFTAPNSWTTQTITTTIPGVAANGVAQQLGASAPTTITEAAVPGFRMTDVTCTGTGDGTQPTVNLAARTISFTALQMAPNSNIACTITNTTTPVVRVQKTTTDGFGGPFSFSQTNLEAAPSDITTTAANTLTPASPAGIEVTSTGTAVTLTEAVPAGYELTSAVCTDANSAVTGNTGGAIGSLVGNVLTIPAANVVAGADFTCVFTNRRFNADLSLTKTSSSPSVVELGVVTFTLTLTNNGPDTSTGVTVTDVVPSGFTVTGTSTLSGTASNSSNTVTWTPADLANGASATLEITATGNAFGSYTNTAEVTAAGQPDPDSTPNDASGDDYATTGVVITAGNASLNVEKTFAFVTGSAPATAGDVIRYSYAVENTGDQTINNVSISDLTNGSDPSFLGGINPGNPPHQATLTTDAGPATGDSTDTNPDPTVWGTLAPGDIITFVADYTVTQLDVDNLQ